MPGISWLQKKTTPIILTPLCLVPDFMLVLLPDVMPHFFQREE